MYSCWYYFSLQFFDVARITSYIIYCLESQSLKEKLSSCYWLGIGGFQALFAPATVAEKCLLLTAQEKAMAPHSSTLAWKIPWMEEPGRLQFMGSLRVGHDWSTSLSLFTFMHWRRKWQPTPVFFPGESQGQGSLVGCHLWDYTESDTTEVT